MSKLTQVINRLTELGCDPTGNGKQWTAKCPAHDDRNPSLSISEGDDGKVLLNCHTGCDINDICVSLGYELSDLMPDNTVDVDSPRVSKAKPKGTSSGSTGFSRAEEAIAWFESKNGPTSDRWSYRNSQGEVVGVILRWDTPNGKDIRPVSLVEGEWQSKGMLFPRPLYSLPDLDVADRVFITEGEKAADAAKTIGLCATTSAHGCNSVNKTDWSPLAGKECVILPDNDASGEHYAEDVTEILNNLTPPCVVKILDLPDLPDRGDIADWVEQHLDNTVDVDTLGTEIEELADNAEVIHTDTVEEYQPFPTDTLPSPIREFVEAGAKAIGCDESYLALPVLSVAAAAIGNTTRLELKNSWSVPSIIWCAIIGESGTAKTPAFKLALTPVRSQERKAEGRYLVSDTTVEALASVLQSQPRGVLLMRDELAGWIASFDRYANGKGGGDMSHWLSMYSGQTMKVDRKTGSDLTIDIPSASVSIIGCIQPTTFRDVFGAKLRDAGLVARMLLACPPRKPKRWTEIGIDPALKQQYEQTIDRLYGLDFKTVDSDRCYPNVLSLTPEAKEAWIEYYNSHGVELEKLDGDLAAAWSKLEECPARIALVFACLHWAASGESSAAIKQVNLESMAAGIKLAQWSKREARRVYAMIQRLQVNDKQTKLRNWIKDKGGQVKVRQVQQGHREFKTSSEAEMALDALARDGHGTWEPSATGRPGQPTRRFVLSRPSTSTPKTRGKGQ
jgi:hypothetical protein